MREKLPVVSREINAPMVFTPTSFSMKLDPILVRALARELDERLRGTRVRALGFDHEHREVRLYTDEGVLSVVVGLGKSPVSVRLLEPQDPPESARRYPMAVYDVTTVPDERILLVRLRRIRGRKTRYALVVELRPSDANVALAEGEDQIVRHLLAKRESRGRRWRTGHPYPYPTSTRLGASGDVERDEWIRRIDPEDPVRSLMREIAFTSPLNAEWIVQGRAPTTVAPSDEPSMDPETLGEAYERWRTLLDAQGAVRWQTGDGGWQPYPHAVGHDAQPGSVLEAFARGDEVADDGGIPRRLLDRLAGLRKRTAKRLESLERQLDEAPESERLRSRGDLLLAHLHQVPRGEASVELTDFDGTTVTVELDPKLSPQDNAKGYYDRAAKAERARARIPGLVAEAREDLDRWTALSQQVEEGGIEADELRAALPDPKKSPSKKDEPSYPYHVFVSSGGLEIRVGKGSKRNDDLTFRHARPNDVWLHARHTAGAHVVLRWDRPEAPPARDLYEAGVLAALNSKARGSGSVPVDWTRRKFVRKPKGAKAGLVVIERQQTVFVEPDPELAERLADPDE